MADTDTSFFGLWRPYYSKGPWSGGVHMQERMDTEGIIYHEPTDSERNLLSFGPYSR